MNMKILIVLLLLSTSLASCTSGVCEGTKCYQDATNTITLRNEKDPTWRKKVKVCSEHYNELRDPSSSEYRKMKRQGYSW